MMTFVLMLSASIHTILLYAGPDQLLPLASVLGGIIGVLLIGWQRFVMLLRRLFQFVTAKLQTSKK